MKSNSADTSWEFGKIHVFFSLALELAVDKSQGPGCRACASHDLLFTSKLTKFYCLDTSVTMHPVHGRYTKSDQ